MITQVVKNSGLKEVFDKTKIVEGVWRSAVEVGGKDKDLAEKLTDQVVIFLNKKFKKTREIKSSQIGEVVEKVLIECGHAKTAKAYILFRENKKHYRQDKESLGVKDDIGLSYNSLFILKTRYLKKNEIGEIVETPREMLVRVARTLSEVEETESRKKQWFIEFMKIMETLEFLPGSRTLANAGKRNPQLANCFVWPLEDDIDEMFEILHKSTLIKKHGGGCGYNFSPVRPEGDSVGGVAGLAVGPVKMMEMFNLMTSLFRQDGKYESGNMVVLNVNHPDILNFIGAKQNDGYLSKTNISVGVTDDFMKSVLAGTDWKLINPRTGEVTNKVNAKAILELMSQMAWSTGDPGLINLSAMNRGTALANPLLKKRGMITTTNPCGEVPLFLLSLVT